MASITMKKVSSGAKLLTSLIKKVDNGDGTLTTKEAGRALGVKPGVPARDPVTLTTVSSAINKVKSRSDRSVDGIVAGVREALDEIKAANADRSASLTDAEAKKVKTPLGKQLLEFSRVHGSDALKDFKLAPPPPEYVPSKPFRAPAGGTAKAWVEAAIKHFNGWANDNSPGYTVGRGSKNVTRYVFGLTETRGVAAEIAKLTPTRAKSALRELGRRIHQQDYRYAGWEPKRLYVEPKAQGVLTALAKKLGITVDVQGDAAAPKYDYY